MRRRVRRYGGGNCDSDNNQRLAELHLLRTEPIRTCNRPSPIPFRPPYESGAMPVGYFMLPEACCLRYVSNKDWEVLNVPFWRINRACGARYLATNS